MLIRAATACFATILLSASSLAQRKPAESTPPKFTARAELVQLTVLVTDKSGAHVSGLKPEDFVVKDNGEAQTVAFFEEIKSVPQAVGSIAQPSAASSPATAQSNLQLAPVAQPLIIIAIDRINTPALDQGSGRLALAHFLAEAIQPGTLVSLVTIDRGGMHLLHPFTADTAPLIALLKGTPSRTAEHELARDPLDDPAILSLTVENRSKIASAIFTENVLVRKGAIDGTLDAMNQLAQAFAAVPGRKSLIWATAGFPFRVVDPQHPLLTYLGNELPNQSLAYERTFRELCRANIAVYPVDVRGLTNPAVVSADLSARNSNIRRVNRLPEAGESARLDQTESFITMESFAKATGGRAFFGHNNLVASFQGAARDSEAYYVLGYYLKEPKPGWHSLNVRANGDAHVRTRSGFFVLKEAPDSREANAAAIALALTSPLDFTALSISATWEQAPGSGGKREIRFSIVLLENAVAIDEASQNHVHLDFLAVARGVSQKSEKPAAQLRKVFDTNLSPDGVAQIRESGVTYSDALRLAPGHYNVRFVVRDNLSGKTGSLTVAIDVT